MEKKLYWFKFKIDFFDDIRIKKLRKIAGGDTFTIIYLRLQLLSLKNGGTIYYEGILDSFAKEIALILDEDEDNVQITIDYLLKHDLLIQGIEENQFVLPNTINCIGSESFGAERTRKFREKQKELTTKVNYSEKMLQCNADVTLDNKIIDNKIEDNKINNMSAYADIIDYLNKKLNSHYRISTRKNQTLINSRLREGYTVEDFKTVIDKKYDEWNNTDMQKYLTPETLFGTKFEKYLQQKQNVKKLPNWYDDYRKDENTNLDIKEEKIENIEDLQDFFK